MTDTTIEIPTQVYRDSIADLRAEIDRRNGVIKAIESDIAGQLDHVARDRALLAIEQRRVAVAEALVSYLIERAGPAAQETAGDGWDDPLR